MAEKRAPTKRRSASEWQTLVAKLAESGEDIAQFCRRQGIYLPTLQWWRWRLRGSTRGLARPARPVPAAAEPIWSQFKELRVDEKASAAVSAEGFELRWPDGLTLAIPPQFDEFALRRLLVVLEVAGC
jgi:transposase-like protein